MRNDGTAQGVNLIYKYSSTDTAGTPEFLFAVRGCWPQQTFKVLKDGGADYNLLKTWCLLGLLRVFEEYFEVSRCGCFVFLECGVFGLTS